MENLTDATEKVKKLEELLAEGIITEKEFKRKKKQLFKKKMTKKEYGKVEQITDATEKVKELEELLAEGVITKKEFKRKKKQLLKKRIIKIPKRRKKEIEQISDEIEKLKKLKESLDSGIITQREFKRKKKQLSKKKITILDVIRDILCAPIIIITIFMIIVTIDTLNDLPQNQVNSNYQQKSIKLTKKLKEKIADSVENTIKIEIMLKYGTTKITAHCATIELSSDETVEVYGKATAIDAYGDNYTGKFRATVRIDDDNIRVVNTEIDKLYKNNN